MSAQLEVRKTYKLFIGGAFPRSESGYSYVVNDAEGRFWANVALASRKDARDSVVAARAAAPGWAGRTAYNRGQIIYRLAEVLAQRRAQFVEVVGRSEGVSAKVAGSQVDQAIDRLVWYAGWTDKLAQVVGNANPVAGPFFNLSTPEPVGVVATIAPAQSSLLGLVSVVGPALAGGNVVIMLTSKQRPIPAVEFAEVCATSDVPAGVVNILPGDPATTGPWLASHMDVNALDLTGLAGDSTLCTELEIAAADNLKRVIRAPAAEPDWTHEPGLTPMTSLLEIKTVWHPIGK